MATKGLTADEVVVILKACGDVQVAVLKFGNLYVRFSRNESPPSPEPWGSVAAPPVPATEIAVKQAEQARLAFEQDELALKEEQLQELKLTDPEEYEKHVINGDLDEESTDGSTEEA